MNYDRPQWNKLLEMVRQEKVNTIYVTYKDRFVRFGFEWFEEYCKKYGTEIVVLNQKSTSPEQELAEDLLSIVTVFSARHHGLRTYKTKLKTEVEKRDNG